jgi:hypothetical protein
MSGPALQTLIGTALVDGSFRAALLNGSRRRMLQSFALSNEQIEVIMEIHADSLQELASEIHRRLIDPQDLEPLPSLRLRTASATHDVEPLRSVRSRIVPTTQDAETLPSVRSETATRA